MKYLEVKEALLSEVNMSPSSLRTLAADIDARAGMEFEMYVPGAAQEDDDYDQEPDYDSDENIRSIQDAYDFFYDGDYNSRRDCERLREQMQESYWEWLGQQFDSRWDGDQEEFVYNYLKENASADEIAEILGVELGEDGEYVADRQAYKDATEKVIEEGYGNYWYDVAREDAQEDFNQNADLESEWLEDIDINTMQDVESNFSITWPHRYNSSGGTVSIEDTADSFGRAIGRAVEASHAYHSGGTTRPSKTELHYVVEPDGSLDEPDEMDDGGLEFVSPALPVTELLDDLKKVKAWADKTGCYTNDSTGLHINVSVAGWKGDLSELDYVKLAILLGDEYIISEFGRQGNTYCKSALKIVKDHIAQQPDDVEKLLNQMKEHLNTSAAKIIHNGYTQKFTSINTKNGYIEFRSPGGDWLNENFDKIENTLLRFVVALDAAVDETKYKQEYAKKLYKLLNPKEAKNTMTYFAQYAAGELPKAALVSFVKQAQLERKVNKEDPAAGKKYWWRVSRPGFGASVEVVATSREEAIEKGKVEYPDWAKATNMEAKPVRPYETQRYEIYNKQTGNALETVPANIDGDDAAEEFLNDYIEQGPHTLQRAQATAMFGIRRIGNKSVSARAGAPVPAGSVGQTTDRPFIWKVTGANDSPYQSRGMEVFASSEFEAMKRARAYWDLNIGQSSLEDWFRDKGWRATPVRPAGPSTPRPVPGVIDIEPDIRPGSTSDLQQQRTSGGFTGSWKVMVYGREVYRFGGVGNVQADANRVAAQWARDNGYELRLQAGDVEVLPIMG
jgi:hypothetical protein